MKIANIIALPIAVTLSLVSASPSSKAEGLTGNPSHLVAQSGATVIYTPSTVTLRDNVISISGFVMEASRNEFALALARAVTLVSDDRPIVLRLDISGIFGDGAQDITGLLDRYRRAGRRFQVIVDGQCAGRCADILAAFEADILKGE